MTTNDPRSLLFNLVESTDSLFDLRLLLDWRRPLVFLVGDSAEVLEPPPPRLCFVFASLSSESDEDELQLLLEDDEEPPYRGSSACWDIDCRLMGTLELLSKVECSLDGGWLYSEVFSSSDSKLDD